MNSLEQRFVGFLDGLVDAESIDQMELTAAQRSGPRADYLLDHRSFVGELKSIRANTAEKIERILEPHRARPEWPQFYGTWPSGTVLARLPDGDRIRKDVFFAVTTSVERDIAKANRQIRSTKNNFSLPEADGLLVIVNDLVEILSPSVIASRVNRLLAKRTPERNRRFPEIAVVWIISETHDLVLASGQRANPSVVISRLPRTHRAVAYTLYLHARWAAFCKLAVAPNDEKIDRDFEKHLRARSQDRIPSRLPRHEWWRRQCREQPYLRALSDEEFFEYGASVLGRAASGLLKGAPRRSVEEAASLWERVMHFFEEVNHRGMDLREWGPDVSARIKASGVLKRPSQSP